MYVLIYTLKDDFSLQFETYPYEEIAKANYDLLKRTPAVESIALVKGEVVEKQ
jgi:hypothetical protein